MKQDTKLVLGVFVGFVISLVLIILLAKTLEHGSEIDALGEKVSAFLLLKFPRTTFVSLVLLVSLGIWVRVFRQGQNN